MTKESALYVRYPGPVDTQNPRDPQTALKAYIWALEQREILKNTTDDVERIANNLGMPQEIIAQIKHHLFFEKYYLEDDYGTLDIDHEQIAAWQRLQDGDYIKNDIQLLKHEYTKSELLKGPAKKVARIAHDTTTSVGLGWLPPLYKDT